MDSANDLIEFYSTGCVQSAAQSWWELYQADAQILRQPDERANILFCIEECSAQENWDWVAQFWNLTEDLYNLGYWNEYEQVDRACLAAAQALGNADMQAAIHGELGWLAIQRGEFQRARAWIESSQRIYARLGNVRGQLIARRYIATIAMAGQEWSSARTQLEELLDSLRALIETGDPEWRAFGVRQSDIIHDSLGIVLQQLNDYARAEHELQLGLAGARARGPLAVATSLLNLGKLRLRQARNDEAEKLFAECWATCRAHEFRAIGAEAQFYLAQLARARGEKHTALELARDCWRVYQALGMTTSVQKTAEFIATLLDS
ncbi:MAG: tetratricopeptide repeat protein [Chloroflexi bacterium]|nr:tetratricopeptide repeat protein [Chloroflexota bacterium]